MIFPWVLNHRVGMLYCMLFIFICWVVSWACQGWLIFPLLHVSSMCKESCCKFPCPLALFRCTFCHCSFHSFSAIQLIPALVSPLSLVSAKSAVMVCYWYAPTVAFPCLSKPLPFDKTYPWFSWVVLIWCTLLFICGCLFWPVVHCTLFIHISLCNMIGHPLFWWPFRCVIVVLINCYFFPQGLNCG